MRVIGGKYRGKKIKTLPGLATRPMTDRVKEDLFNILNNYFIFENKIGLDIFAGSAQLGLEGLSRGLKFCYFNDYSLEANKIMQENLTFVNIDSYILWQDDYLHILQLLEIKKIKIDILFLDPPFKEIDYYYNIINFLLLNNILNNFGIIACETNSILEVTYKNLILLKHKVYNNKHLYVFRLEWEEE